MSVVRRYHHGALRRHLIAAARAEVESHGADQVVLARLAQSCGVSVAAPYRHFASKEALLLEVALVGFAELGAELAGARREGTSPSDQLLDAGVAYVRFAIAHPQLFRLMFTSAVPDGTGPEAPGLLGVGVRLVRACPLAVPLEVAVRACWAGIHGYATLCVAGVESFAGLSDEAIRSDLGALVAGLLAEAPGVR